MWPWLNFGKLVSCVNCINSHSWETFEIIMLNIFPSLSLFFILSSCLSWDYQNWPVPSTAYVYATHKHNQSTAEHGIYPTSCVSSVQSHTHSLHASLTPGAPLGMALGMWQEAKRSWYLLSWSFWSNMVIRFYSPSLNVSFAFTLVEP